MLTVCGIETTCRISDGRKLQVVATVLTVCGIETGMIIDIPKTQLTVLQQCLPFAVLKLILNFFVTANQFVATVLTVCGIETVERLPTTKRDASVATVLTVCGIETATTSGQMHQHD